MELDSEHKGPVRPPATLVIARHLGEGDWGQVLMSTSTSSVFPPWGLPAHSSALPRPQGDPHLGDFFSSSNMDCIHDSLEIVLLAGDDNTTPWPISKTPLVAEAPHHDVAFEEEGWLQADAKLLGTRACNVTVEERGRQSRIRGPQAQCGCEESEGSWEMGV